MANDINWDEELRKMRESKEAVVGLSNEELAAKNARFDRFFEGLAAEQKQALHEADGQGVLGLLKAIFTTLKPAQIIEALSVASSSGQNSHDNPGLASVPHLAAGKTIKTV